MQVSEMDTKNPGWGFRLSLGLDPLCLPVKMVGRSQQSGIFFAPSLSLRGSSLDYLG